MKAADRLEFMRSLELAEKREIDVALVNKLIKALIHNGFCFTRPAPAWAIGNKPNNETRVQIEFGGERIKLIRLGKFKDYNSFPLLPDVLIPLDSEDDIPAVVAEIERLYATGNPAPCLT